MKYAVQEFVMGQWKTIGEHCRFAQAHLQYEDRRDVTWHMYGEVPLRIVNPDGFIVMGQATETLTLASS